MLFSHMAVLATPAQSPLDAPDGPSPVAPFRPVRLAALPVDPPRPSYASPHGSFANGLP